MEEFTGEEASSNNQIFPEEPAQPAQVEPVASASIPSYAPDSHVPTADVRALYFVSPTQDLSMPHLSRSHLEA